MMRLRHYGAAFVVTAVLAAACARNPATGQNELMLVSESQEIHPPNRGLTELSPENRTYPRWLPRFPLSYPRLSWPLR